MKKSVVVVIGYPGCGKSSVCKLIEEQGYHVHRPSDVIRAYAAQNGHELIGRQDYVDVHHRLNVENPYAIIEPVINSDHDTICIDGLRAPVLLDKLSSELPDVTVIALACPIEERFQRVQADDIRKGTHRAPATLEDFRTDELPDYRNPDRNLPNMEEMMARAGYTIDASQSPERVAAEVLAILQNSQT